jgi:ribosomal protein L22
MGASEMTNLVGFTEMYTTPREKEAKKVKSILRKNQITFRSQEEKRGYGWRYCIYVPTKMANKALKVLETAIENEEL